jgi:hypothetical protein
MGMGRHVGGGPSLMHALVGAACATLVLEQVETWIQQPGSPNLYWALTNLPRPFVDFGKAMEAEKISLDSFFGRDLRDMLGKPRLEPFSPSRIRVLQRRMSEFLNQSRDEQIRHRSMRKVELELLVVSGHAGGSVCDCWRIRKGCRLAGGDFAIGAVGAPARR